MDDLFRLFPDLPWPRVPAREPGQTTQSAVQRQAAVARTRLQAIRTKRQMQQAQRMMRERFREHQQRRRGGYP